MSSASPDNKCDARQPVRQARADNTDRRFIEHWCHCGKWGSFGSSDGKWFCGVHLPVEKVAL